MAAPCSPIFASMMAVNCFGNEGRPFAGVGDGAGTGANERVSWPHAPGQAIAGSEVEFQLVLVLLNTFPQGRLKMVRLGAPTWKEV